MKTHFLAVSSFTDAAFFGSTFKLLEELSVKHFCVFEQKRTGLQTNFFTKVKRKKQFIIPKVQCCGLAY